MTDQDPGGRLGARGDEPAPSSTAPRANKDLYLRRRIAVAASALTAVLLLAGVVVLSSDGGGAERLGSVDIASTSTTTTTTTTTTIPVVVPAATTTSTSTTTTSTTSTTSTTTTTTTPPPTTILRDGVPIWEPYDTLPALDGVAALTGLPADDELTARPILAVKIDNFSRARPQWGLERADVIIEENVEGVTRFVALFHSDLPDRVGPVRSARTGDLDLFAMMNRPILAWSGGNAGVTRWIRSAAFSQVLIDFTAQSNPCYQRSSSRSAPHNLILDPECAVSTATEAGPARPLWAIRDGAQDLDSAGVTPDTTFEVAMDGVRVSWTWDAERGAYLRSQNGNRHLGISGDQIAVNNVVELFTAHPPSPVDGRSPNPVTVGGGRAVIHRDGVAIEAVWGRTTAYNGFGFATADTNERIYLDQGRTFMHLARA